MGCRTVCMSFCKRWANFFDQLTANPLMSCKGTLRQVFISLRTPPPLGFCLGWSSKFVGSESGLIQCNTSAEYEPQHNPISYPDIYKIIQSMFLYSPTATSPPLPPSHLMPPFPSPPPLSPMPLPSFPAAPVHTRR